MSKLCWHRGRIIRGEKSASLVFQHGWGVGVGGWGAGWGGGGGGC